MDFLICEFQFVFLMHIYSGHQITQHKWAWPFLQPVDVEGLGLDDYYKVKLIAFSSKLCSGWYKN